MENSTEKSLLHIYNELLVNSRDVVYYNQDLAHNQFKDIEFSDIKLYF